MSGFDDEFAGTKAAVQGTPGEQGQWKSLSEMLPDCELFNSVDPADMNQGGIGDCWLICAMASVAEYPAVIESMISDQGDHYCVRIYSFAEGDFKNIEVNDEVPTVNGQPCMVKPTRENEIWPCILEKAFAKYSGGYEQLCYGFPSFALAAMMGCTDIITYWQEKSTGDYTVKVPSFEEDTVKSGVSWDFHPDANEDDVYLELLEADKQQYLMCAGSNTGSDTHQSAKGVVLGHAYTILDVQDCPAGTDFRLIQLRNPWGQGEWKGAWSDGSAEWANNPDVAALLDPSHKEDGAFWMTWDDFQAEYTLISICKARRNVIPSITGCNVRSRLLQAGGCTVNPAAPQCSIM